MSNTVPSLEKYIGSLFIAHLIIFGAIYPFIAAFYWELKPGEIYIIGYAALIALPFLGFGILAFPIFHRIYTHLSWRFTPKVFVAGGGAVLAMASLGYLLLSLVPQAGWYRATFVPHALGLGFISCIVYWYWAK